MKKIIFFSVLFFIISCSPNYKEMSPEQLNKEMYKLLKKGEKGPLSAKDLEKRHRLITIKGYKTLPKTLNDLKSEAEEYISKYNDEVYDEYKKTKLRDQTVFRDSEFKGNIILRMEINKLKPKAEEYIAKNNNTPHEKYSKSEYEVVSKYIELKQELEKREEIQLAVKYLMLKDHYERIKIDYENLD